MTLNAVRLAPVAPSLYNSDGSLNWALSPQGVTTWGAGGNPLASNYNVYTNKTYNLITNAVISYKLLPGLEVGSSFGYTNLYSKENLVGPLTAVAPEERPFSYRYGFFVNGSITSWIVEPQISYNKSISKGKLDLILGSTFNKNDNNGQQLLGYGHNSDLVLEDIKSAAFLEVNSTYISTYKYNAFFGRLNFNWDKKYLVNVTGRRDGSSRFGESNRFHNFASLGLGWLFSDEKFMQKISPVLSFGKLKLSYGTTGNDQIGDYSFMDNYTPIGNISAPYQGITALNLTRLQNQYLEWERTNKAQAGMELGFLQNRILITACYFSNRSSNQLLSYALPITTGFFSIAKNFPATVQNHGWELSFNSVNVKNKVLSWSSSFNITVSRNKLVEFPGLETSSYATSLFVGKPITTQLVYKFMGVDPTTGKFQVVDINGNLTTNPNASTDKYIIVNTSPTLFGGLNNSLTYKNIDLDFLFQFVKQKGQNYSFGASTPGGNGRTNQPVSVLDRWQKPGDVSRNQRFNSNATLATNFSNATESDAAWADASFVRLKNVSLSWRLPENLIRKMHLQNFKLYAQGQNLLTITNYDGLDPETRSSLTLPPLRLVALGVQIGL
jgi:TonB-linked SusC/RagA family outer membrane protein